MGPRCAWLGPQTKSLDSLATLLAGRAPQRADCGARERWVGSSAADRLAKQLLERSALAALADGERRTLERSKLPHESGETVLSASAGLWEAVRALRGTIRLCCDGRYESDRVHHVLVLKALGVLLDGGDDSSKCVRGWMAEQRGLLHVGARLLRHQHVLAHGSCTRVVHERGHGLRAALVTDPATSALALADPATGNVSKRGQQGGIDLKSARIVRWITPLTSRRARAVLVLR